MCGASARSHPHIVEETYQRGHEIANHSWDHNDLTVIASKEAIEQLENTNKILEGITGSKVTKFRPPYGSYNQELIEVAERLGLECIMWTNNGSDWLNHSPEHIADSILSELKPNGILLLHDGCGDLLCDPSADVFESRSSTVVATGIVLDRLARDKAIFFDPRQSRTQVSTN